jgi:hypothetical protein
VSEARVDVAEVTPGEWRVMLRSSADPACEVLDAGEARERADASEAAGDTALAHELRKAALAVDERTIAI